MLWYFIRMRMRCFSIWLCFLLVGCVPAMQADVQNPADVVVDARPRVVPLLTRSFEDSDRYYVAVTLEGEEVAMQLDTGSGLSFLFQPANTSPYIPDFATLEIAGETISVAARNIDIPTPDIEGLRVVGLLGMEYLLKDPTVFDRSQNRMLRYDEWPSALASNALYTVAFDNVQDHALFPLTLDEEPVRLLFDTGGGHTLWVGQEGRPGDSESSAVDAEGNIFPIFTGVGELRFDGQSVRSVPVARAPEFPYFEGTVTALGGNLHGLLGVTAFGLDEALLFGEQERVYVVDTSGLGAE